MKSPVPGCLHWWFSVRSHPFGCYACGSLLVFIYLSQLVFSSCCCDFLPSTRITQEIFQSTRSLIHQFRSSVCMIHCVLGLGWVCIIVGRSRFSFRVIGSKDLRIHGLNCIPTVIFRTRPSGVWWNVCEDIYYSSIRYLSLILHVVLLALFYGSAAVTSPVLRADSLSIASRSWPS
jgi:hypothetical protein